MNTYTNRKTGAVIETESVVTGANWVLTDNGKKKGSGKIGGKQSLGPEEDLSPKQKPNEPERE